MQLLIIPKIYVTWPHINLVATIYCKRRYFKEKKPRDATSCCSLFMANFIATPSIVPTLYSRNRHPNYSTKFRCNAKTPIDNSSSEPENAFLKIAWYGSEFLGIAASFLRSPPKNGDSATAHVDLPLDGLGKIDRAAVVEAIKQDFETSYFVTGNSVPKRFSNSLFHFPPLS